MEYVMSVRGDPAPEAGRIYGGMIAAIEATAVEMRARGLHVQVGDGVPASTASPGKLDLYYPAVEDGAFPPSPLAVDPPPGNRGHRRSPPSTHHYPGNRRANGPGGHGP